MRILTISLLVVGVGAGCASRTRITTEANATIVEADTGRAIGTGVGDYQDSKPVWSSTTFRIEKEGCKTKDLTINRSDSMSIGMILAGCFLIVPWLWSGDYHPSYGTSLECGRTPGTGH